MQIIAKVVDSLMTMAAVPYQRAVGKRLADYGLRYEDLYDPLLDGVSSRGVGDLQQTNVELEP
jgi:hypothetical protein